ncbi:NADP-dependent malic enzyme [Candidatus Uhrbacteria bacterium]|jgi:malate dehydrogenase (oxaloacetate-decarboxylating)|nr:NADP-dependent malic enzyme [Candidatus Uhrbacteria bacterium]
MNYAEASLKLHEEKRGKLEVVSTVPVTNKEELSVAYTPGVAEPCRVIAKEKERAFDLTMKGNTVAVVTDGSAVLGLGNIGPEAGLPVMEGKAVLFKEFAGVDAFPIALNTQDVDEIVETVIRISPGFGGINIEDISAPRCFEVERLLLEKLDIPVFHDDQHGTAIVILAGLINALKVTGKEMSDLKLVVSGAGAAGLAASHLLWKVGVKNIVVLDSRGVIFEGRENLNKYKEEIIPYNVDNAQGDLAEAVKGRDVFIGVSAPNVLTADMVSSMNEPIVFAMANPDPEIMPDLAKSAGAAVVATGRSDFPNQVNNVLAFPGIFKGALAARVERITDEMKIAAAEAIAGMVKNPTADEVIPDPFTPGIADAVAEAVKKHA